MASNATTSTSTSSSSGVNHPSVTRLFCRTCDVWYMHGEDHEHRAKDIANTEYCSICKINFKPEEKHFQTSGHIDAVFNTDQPIVLVETAVQCRLKTFFLKNLSPRLLSFHRVLKQQEPLMVIELKKALAEWRNVKSNLLLYAYYVKTENDAVIERKMVSFKTVNIALNRTTDLRFVLSGMTDAIVHESENFLTKGSGWTLERIVGTEFRINRHYQLCRGGKHIKLPFPSNYIVNVQNNDEKCFKYAMLGKYLPGDTKKKYRVGEYEKLPKDIYNFDCVSFPVDLHDIPKFEKANKHREVSISVYGIRPAESGDKKKKKRHIVKNGGYIIYPLRVAKEELANHTNLLYYGTAEGDRHFCWISSLTKLVRSQVTTKACPMYLCGKCLTHSFKQSRMEKHKRICQAITNESFLPVYPDEPFLYFKNHEREIKHQCVVYADFESYLRRLEPEEEENQQEKPTFAYQRHDPLSVAYVVCSSHPQLRQSTPILYRRDDANEIFLNDMIELAKKASRYNNDKNSKIIMSDDDKRAYEQATHCAHCNVDFKQAKKVRDHDHQYVPPEKSNYRKALCKKCNLKYVHAKRVVVYFHNSSRYDLHYVVKALAGSNHRVSIIPSTEENYITLNLKVKGVAYSISFQDSFRFLPSSLDELVSQLPETAFHYTKMFANTPTLFQKCRRKAILPYDYIENGERLDITHPPPRAAFYNRLTNRHVTEEEYARFCEMWHLFKCKNLGEYLDKYLSLDVCLLADVFEENRRCFMETHKLDPANYPTLPSFGFDSFLKLTGARIETFTDHDMTLMVMDGICGGVTQCVTRYAKANNTMIPETYDPSKPSTFIQYVDATGLYANAMCQSLPYAGYRWLKRDELDNLDVMSMPNDGDEGVILEVSLEYPDHLHDLHSDLPFCPRTTVPPAEGSKTKKLLTTLENKENIVMHYVALKQALEHGLVLRAIHRGIGFKQRPFLKEFIDLNARLRMEAKDNKFRQSLMKLISNSCFGKFLENPMKRKKIELGTNPASILKLISRIDFQDRTIFDEELVAVHLKRTEVQIDRPMIVGLSILALSKVIMYDYFYSHILLKYGRDNVKLLYMDTDSYVMKLTTEDRYLDMVSDLHLYDTSNFPADHFLYSKVNHKKLGTFTDETGGKPISEFVGLGSKVYAIKTVSGKVEMRAKGVQRCVKDSFTFDHYMRVLQGEGAHVVNVCQIVSKKHTLYTQQTRKRALTGIDDKRVILDDGINTLPYGHRDLRGEEEPELVAKKRSPEGDGIMLPAKRARQ